MEKATGKTGGFALQSDQRKKLAAMKIAVAVLARADWAVLRRDKGEKRRNLRENAK